MTPLLAASDEGFIDVLASGVHDTKNTLFDALSRIGAVRDTLASSGSARRKPMALLAEAHVAVERSADRLAKLLSAYRLIRQENPVVLLPTPLGISPNMSACAPAQNGKARQRWPSMPWTTTSGSWTAN